MGHEGYSKHSIDQIQGLKYNCLGGKCNRGISVIDTARILQGKDLTPEQFQATATLGWLTELLQAFFLVADDIMDDSHTRRGQPCWFRVPEVGLNAVNDSLLLESCIYLILRTRFRTHPAYVDLIELFHDIIFKTEVGQLCDLITAPEDHVELSKFSLDKFYYIVRYKTAWYSFYLPVALSLHYLQLATPSNLKQAEHVLIPLGEYFQAQDDFLDGYGTPEQIGKIGTDIQDNKCSWLINQALAKATPEQRKVLDENYGRKDKAKEAKVKEVYTELKLDQLYAEWEEEQVGNIRKLIADMDEQEGLKKQVFEAFLQKIYKRSK
jgi:farnesyl diphosphate synthase